MKNNVVSLGLSVTLLGFAIALGSCFNKTSSQGQSPKIKNVILMIGDGMGPQQISLLHYFAKYSKLGVVAPEDFIFKKIANEGAIGVSATEPHRSLVVDSASSATQLALGMSSRSEMIGLDKDGNTQETILEKAKKRGLRTGLISDTRLTHATPASFATHVANRWYETEIAAGFLKSQPDVLLSSGINAFISDTTSGFAKADAMELKPRRKDGRNLLQEAVQKGYQLAFDRKDLDSFEGNKVLGLFAPHNMPDGIWYTKNRDRVDRKIPNLEEMSRFAISELSQGDQGFFLMIEGGQIDWGGHRNDVGVMLHQMIHFNNTVKEVYDWVKDRDDTLLVVTADHETGSFGFSYNTHQRPTGKKITGDFFADKVFKPGYNYGTPTTVDKIYGQTLSFHQLQAKFHGLPAVKQTPARLQKMVKKATGYLINLAQAKRILRTAPNKAHDPTHRSLKIEVMPEIEEFTEFYSDSQNSWDALLGRALSAQQNVVWGTGHHTATPVMVFAAGPESAIAPFRGYISHPEIGAKMQEALELK